MAYTDPDTGITFDTWTVSETLSTGGFTFGMALPSDALTTDSSEFIGYLVCGSIYLCTISPLPILFTKQFRSYVPRRILPPPVGVVFRSGVQ